MNTAYILPGILGFVLGVLITVIVYFVLDSKKLIKAKVESEDLREKARQEYEMLTKKADLDARDIIQRKESEFEGRANKRRLEMQQRENRITQKEVKIEQKSENIEKKQTSLNEREKKLEVKEQDINNLYDEQVRELEKISGITVIQAKEMIFDKVEKTLDYELAIRVRDLEEEAKEKSNKKAKEILADAMQRCSSGEIVESLVSVVNLPNESMKGRIIGREGRNIRTLENLTGVDLIIDDTPGAVVLSAFNNINREIARIALEELISDGRIHPRQIEKVVEKVTKEINAYILETGERAALEAGVHGLKKPLLEALGRLRFRSSYGQNVLQHSIEVANLSGIMAAEIGVNVQIAKRAGLLHDIGKMMDSSSEGSHAIIGANFAARHKEKNRVVNAIAAHHEEKKPECIEAVLVQAADAISASRVGARKEVLETYIERLTKLEELAKDYSGVVNCYAIQAGRELRVIVNPEKVDDVMNFKLARDIALNIEKEVEYSGQVKVVVIRETRAIEYTK